MSATVSILGNLGRAPETRVAPDGTFVATFSIASNSVRSSPSGRVEKTDWFRVTAFGDQGRTLLKHARKGTRLLVQGKLTCQGWMSRDGVPQVGAEVLLQDFQFAESRETEYRHSRGDESNAETGEYRIETGFTGSDIQEIEDQILNY